MHRAHTLRKLVEACEPSSDFQSTFPSITTTPLSPYRLSNMLRRTLIQPLRPMCSSRKFSTRLPHLQSHQQPKYQAPSSEPPPAPASASASARPNPHREIYKTSGAGRAIAYNFLIAMATFQVLYWGWLKLESMEIKKEKGEEVKLLEGELNSLTGEK